MRGKKEAKVHLLAQWKEVKKKNVFPGNSGFVNIELFFIAIALASDNVWWPRNCPLRHFLLLVSLEDVVLWPEWDHISLLQSPGLFWNLSPQTLLQEGHYCKVANLWPQSEMTSESEGGRSRGNKAGVNTEWLLKSICSLKNIAQPGTSLTSTPALF